MKYGHYVLTPYLYTAPPRPLPRPLCQQDLGLNNAVGIVYTSLVRDTPCPSGMAEACNGVI